MIESIIAQIWGNFKLAESKFLKNIRGIIDKSFFIVVVIFLVLISFILGRITKFLENRPTFTVQDFESIYMTEKVSLEKKVPRDEYILASKGGKKYYYIWCKGSENIKEENKRYFKDEESARIAGYTLANNCK